MLERRGIQEQAVCTAPLLTEAFAAALNRLLESEVNQQGSPFHRLPQSAGVGKSSF